MRPGRFVILALLLLCVSSAARAENESRDPRALLDGLHYQSGQIRLRDGIATLTVGPSFTYIAPADAETFLVKIWSNPPGSGNRTLGLLLPKDVDLLTEKGWAVVIGYDDSGYVSDSDASGIDYDDLLKDMQKSTEEANQARREKGYPAVTLVGWATPPHYDPATHKLYWAKRLSFEGSAHDTLNYNIRALGRRGVLVLNAVGSIDQLAIIEQRTPEVLDMVAFNPGNTYAEYDSHVDKMAAYGIAGLIAGGVLAKVGVFKALLLAVLAFKKVVILGGLAVFGAISTFFKRLFGRRPG
jgi:uncharacterized membrane-anchored protein